MKGITNFTKKDRHNIYIKAKKHYESDNYPHYIGMCECIAYICSKEEKPIFLPCSMIESLFDEMEIIKPENANDLLGNYWWPDEDRKTRLEMFDKIIEMTKP